MTPSRIRFQYIYRPFLLVLGCFLLCYTTLHWLLVFKLRRLPLSEWRGFWALPVGIAIVLMLLLLYRRIGLLGMDGRPHDKVIVANCLLTIVSLAGPVAATQYFLADAAAEWHVLEKPEDIAQHPSARYYIIRHHRADRFNHYRVLSSTPGGRNDRQEYVYLNIAVPLYAPAKAPKSPVIRPLKIVSKNGQPGEIVVDRDYAPPVHAAVWTCYEYRTSLDQGLEPWHRDTLLQRFTQSSLKHIHQVDPDGFTYLRRPIGQLVTDRYVNTVKTATKKEDIEPQVLEPVYAPFEDRYQKSLLRAIIVLLVACLAMCGMVFGLKLDKKKWQQMQKKRTSRRPWPDRWTWKPSGNQ